jgi:hypothetical protein
VVAPGTVPAHPVAIQPKLAVTQQGTSVCQRGETLPRGTTAIRFLLKALVGPRITVKAFAGARIVTSGERGPGWTSGAVTVPVARVGRTVAHAKVCLAFALSNETVDMEGECTSRARLLLLGISSYRGFPEYGASSGEAHYLLPPLPLLGALVALSARGAGRRWGPILGTLIAVLAFAHDIFSQLQVISRYCS